MGSLIQDSARRPAACASVAGFTLIEVLVVLAIIGMTLGMVSLSIMPNRAQTLQTDARRISLLLQLARDEGIVRNRPIAFEAYEERYRFLIRDDNGGWKILQDELLREREFTLAPVRLQMSSTNAVPTNPLRIVFGREPVDQPFILTISTGDEQVAISADGVGHFALQ